MTKLRLVWWSNRKKKVLNRCIWIDGKYYRICLPIIDQIFLWRGYNCSSSSLCVCTILAHIIYLHEDRLNWVNIKRPLICVLESSRQIDNQPYTCIKDLSCICLLYFSFMFHDILFVHHDGNKFRCMDFVYPELFPFSIMKMWDVSFLGYTHILCDMFKYMVYAWMWHKYISVRYHITHGRCFAALKKKSKFLNRQQTLTDSPFPDSNR